MTEDKLNLRNKNKNSAIALFTYNRGTPTKKTQQ